MSIDNAFPNGLQNNTNLQQKLLNTRSLGALRAPTSSWRPFGPLDFVLRALRALRPCIYDAAEILSPTDQRTNEQGNSRSRIRREKDFKRHMRSAAVSGEMFSDTLIQVDC